MSLHTYFFKHSCSLRDDPDCLSIIKRYGAEGYGIALILIEYLGNRPGNKAPLKSVSSLAKMYSFKTIVAKNIIEKYDLFQNEDEGESFFSPYLREQMIEREQFRKWGKEGGRKSAEIRQRNLERKGGLTQASREGQPLEKKENDSKEEERKGEKLIPPSLEKVIDYFLENGYERSAAIKFFEAYNWAEKKDTKGNVIKDWKKKAQKIWFTDDHKIKNKQSPGSGIRIHQGFKPSN